MNHVVILYHSLNRSYHDISPTAGQLVPVVRPVPLMLSCAVPGLAPGGVDIPWVRLWWGEGGGCVASRLAVRGGSGGLIRPGGFMCPGGRACVVLGAAVRVLGRVPGTGAL